MAFDGVIPKTSEHTSSIKVSACNYNVVFLSNLVININITK